MVLYDIWSYLIHTHVTYIYSYIKVINRKSLADSGVRPFFWGGVGGGIRISRLNLQKSFEACSSKMAWPVLHGVTGPITQSRLCAPLHLDLPFWFWWVVLCVLVFFCFFGETTEKQNLWFKFFLAFCVWCVWQLCVCEGFALKVNWWSFTVELLLVELVLFIWFLWGKEKGIPSHPTKCHQNDTKLILSSWHHIPISHKFLPSQFKVIVL